MEWEVVSANLKQILDELEAYDCQAMSETDTRVKIIDQLLHDVLEWDMSCITREEHILPGFIDYRLDGANNRYILEAKSTKINFSGISPKSKRELMKTSKISKQSSELADAIEQARKYAAPLLHPFFVVSNGINFFIGKTFITGHEKVDLICYQGRECVENFFPEIYSILSDRYDGSKTFIEILKEEDIRTRPVSMEKISKNLINTDITKGSNSYAQILMPILNKYFEEILEDDEFSDEAYCEVGNLDSYSEVMKKYLKSRASALGLPFAQVHSDNSLAEELTMDRMINKEGHLFILFGNVGVGKTTFLSRFYNKKIAKPFKDNLVWANCDLQNWHPDTGDLMDKINDSVEDALQAVIPSIFEFSELQKLYGKEIERNMRGIWAPIKDNTSLLNEKLSDFLGEKVKNRTNYLELLLNYVKETYDYEVILVFDNLDQHSLLVQEKVVLYAVTQTKNNKMLSILSLRDETYWLLRKRSPLDAYGNYTAYQITPPSMNEVLNRRIDYTLKKLKDEKWTYDYVNPQGNSYVIKASYAQVLTLLKNSINKDDNKYLLENLSNLDIRLGLRLFKAFVLSGHIDINNIVEYNAGKVDKVIPPDKVIKGIGLGQNKFYSSEKSDIFNLFSIYEDGFYSHFISFIILNVLSEKEETVGPVIDGQGFISLEDLQRLIYPYCKNVSALRKMLSSFIYNGLIDTDIGSRQQLEKLMAEYKYVRITPAGKYYKTQILIKHQYLEMILIDTPIKDPEVSKNLLELQNKIERSRFPEIWEYKFKIVNDFLSYLYTQERIDADFVNDTPNKLNMMSKLIEQIHLEQDEIRSKLDQRSE